MTPEPAATAPAPELRLALVEPAVGAALAGERRAQRQSLEQVAAATRIRVGHLRAIERDELESLPGPVYARGYVRTYANHLGLDPEPLLERMPPPAPAEVPGRGSLSLARLAPRLPAGLVVTGPGLAGIAVALAVGLFGAYAWYEIRSARLDAAPAAAPAAARPPIASPMPLPSGPPAPAPEAAASGPVVTHPIAVAIRATELVWVQVTVDGKAVYGDAGRMLQPGTEDVFVGGRVAVRAGKPSLLVSLSGAEYAPLGALSREFSAQT